MTEELDWDSLDSGRLHCTVSPARTVDGTAIVVAVIDRADSIPQALEDAAMGQATAPLWLYVPKNLDVGELAEWVVVRAI